MLPINAGQQNSILQEEGFKLDEIDTARWNLIDKGELKFTKDRKLQACAPHPHQLPFPNFHAETKAEITRQKLDQAGVPWWERKPIDPRPCH